MARAHDCYVLLRSMAVQNRFVKVAARSLHDRLHPRQPLETIGEKDSRTGDEKGRCSGLSRSFAAIATTLEEMPASGPAWHA